MALEAMEYLLRWTFEIYDRQNEADQSLGRGVGDTPVALEETEVLLLEEDRIRKGMGRRELQMLDDWLLRRSILSDGSSISALLLDCKLSVVRSIDVCLRERDGPTRVEFLQPLSSLIMIRGKRLFVVGCKFKSMVVTRNQLLATTNQNTSFRLRQSPLK